MKVICDDCVKGMRDLVAGSVSLVIADLPYGMTQNKWDRRIPLDPLWREIKRVCKSNAVIVFTAMQPFTSELVLSNVDMFKYELIWKKNKSTGFLNAKKQPLRAHENILVFYTGKPTYNPQMTSGHKPVNAATKKKLSSNYGKTAESVTQAGSTLRYPTTVLDVAVVNNDSPDRIHPTQKPVELLTWLIKTYTNEGDLVLDPTAGSGSTGVASISLSRRFVGFETDAEMAGMANDAILTAILKKGAR